MKNTFKKLVLAAAMMSPASLLAAETPAGIQFSGYMDLSYMHYLGTPRPITGLGTPVGGNVLGRYYDQNAGMFQANLVELTAKKTAGSVSFVMDLDFGPTADLNATDLMKNVGQAVVSWTPTSTPWLLVEAGKLPTHVGYELMKARDNWQYSRSFTYSWGMPVYHSGVHLGMTAIPGQLVASVYGYNGWNSNFDNNSISTLGAQLKWTPSEALTVYYNFISGPENGANVAAIRTVHEANATYVVNSDLSFAVEALSGTETGGAAGGGKDAAWSGMSLHSKWAYSATAWLSPRLEWYNDPQGYTTGGYLRGAFVERSLASYTVTAGWNLGDGLESRLEVRNDSSSVADFLSDNKDEKSQTTATAALLVSF